MDFGSSVDHLGFLSLSTGSTIEATFEAVKRFARADAQRFALRDRLSASDGNGQESRRDNTMTKRWISIGAFSAALSVVLGAFGAHGLKEHLPPESLKAFETAV